MMTEAHDITHTVSRALAPRKDVTFAYIFGSVARQRSNASSDVDVAVQLDDGTDLLRRGAQIDALLQIALKNSRVDVVALDNAPLGLRYEIQLHGIVVVDRDPRARVAFEARTRKEYWDFQPRLAVYAEALAKRLKEGTFGT